MNISKDQAVINGEFLQSESKELSLGDLLHTLSLRRRLLISVTVLLSFLAVLVIFQLTPRYNASTQLLIGVNDVKILDIQEVLSGNFNNETAINGEIEVLKSRELARKVIDSLHLDQYEEFNPELKKAGLLSSLNLNNILPASWLDATGLMKVDKRNQEEKDEARLTEMTDRFLRHLSVSQIKRSQVISVGFESEDPKLAAKVANEIADKYIIGQLQAKFDATKKATGWLNDQLVELRHKVEESEQAVVAYRKTHELVEISKDLGLSQQQLSEINSQLAITRAERAEAEAKYQQIEAIARSGRDIDSVSEVLNSTLISRLREQESEVQRKYSEMLVEFGPRHPKMIQMQAELADIDSKIHIEVKKIAAGLRNSMEVARAREASLAGSLKQMESKHSGTNQAEVELHALDREASANKALFETFLGRFKETASTQGIEQADARVISFAETPLNASFPNIKILIVVSVSSAFIFAVFLVFAIESLNPGVRTPEEVHELFNLTTLGIVPKIVESNFGKPHEYLLAKPQSALAEAINTLRISLSLLNPDALVKSVLITSSVPQEGKSTLSSLIARHSASSGQHVVLVDADLRRPTVAKTFDLDENALGLTDLLMNHDLTVNDVLINDPQTGLKILTRGKAAFVNPIDLFASQRMRAIIAQLRNDFDLVVIDSAPIMSVPDSRILSGLVDKSIFVINWDKTPKKVVRSALQTLNRDGHANLAGIVLQKVNLEQYGRYGYQSGYYYHYGRYKEYYSG